MVNFQSLKPCTDGRDGIQKASVMIMPLFAMAVAVALMVFVGNIIHAAFRAFARLAATAASAVHGANISRSIFWPGLLGGLFLRSAAVVLAMPAATGGQRKGKYEKGSYRPEFK